MLEYRIAKQLTEAGVSFEYEPFSISYIKRQLPLEDDETYQTWTKTHAESGAA